MQTPHGTFLSRPITTALATALVVGWIVSATAQERITWTNQVNVAVRGNTLEKTRGCDGCGDAGATSRQSIRANDGYAEFRVNEDWTYWLAGLGRGTRTTSFDDIDFAIRFNGNGRADIVERGEYVGGDIDYSAGDVFRVEVVNDRVRYVKNGDVFRVSQRRPSYPLVLDVALGTVGASVANARIGTESGALAGFDSQNEFSGLDRNGDGLITRREWAGTRRAFNERDLDRDGLLTPDELGVADDIDRRGDIDRRDDINRREVVGTSGEIVSVSALERWTDTGLTVRAGDAITFEADGIVQMSGNRNDTANPSGSRRNAPGALVRDAAAGTLIGRIGNGTPFAVGQRRTISRAPVTGRLYLSVNDDYLNDNEGAFEVMVTIDPR
jgi:hypothetical protein